MKVLSRLRRRRLTPERADELAQIAYHAESGYGSDCFTPPPRPGSDEEWERVRSVLDDVETWPAPDPSSSQPAHLSQVRRRP
jgi:hypothetical protein